MRGVRTDPERMEVRMLRRCAPLAGARVLEIGCGDGRLTRRIAGITRSMVSMDLNLKDVAVAQRLLPERLSDRVRFAVGSAGTLNFSDGRFDVVLLSWSL